MHDGQLSYTERCCIAESLEIKPPMAISEIARKLGRSKSTICDELKRNRQPDGTYLACTAEEMARARRSRPRGAYKKDNPTVLRAIEEGLKKKWSPRLIADGLKKMHPSNPLVHVSHQTIYEIVWEDKCFGGQLYKNLPHGSHKRRKRYGTAERRGQIPNRLSIDIRPAEANDKRESGHWEGDTIAGCKGGKGIASFVDRKSQYLILEPLENGTAEELNRAARRGFHRHSNVARHSLTVDNGKEFTRHEDLAKMLGLDVYFAHPYSPWERGLNEQVNGMVRWWFPKGTDFAMVTRGQIKAVEKLLNERPRELLGYRTPAEVIRSSVRLQI
jgi:transposase, IS30 family